MLATLVVVFLVWLPVATTLEAVVAASGSRPWVSRTKQGLYLALAAPALFANWLTVLVQRNQRTVARLTRVGDWLKS